MDLLPDSNQPFHLADNPIHCVVNGEMHNRDRIHADLVQNWGINTKGTATAKLSLLCASTVASSFSVN